MQEKLTEYTFSDVKKVLWKADRAVASYHEDKRITVELALLRDTHQTYIFEYLDLLKLSVQKSGLSGEPGNGPYSLLSEMIQEEQITVDEHNRHYLQNKESQEMIQPFEHDPKNTDAYPIRSAAEKANLAYDMPDNEFGICVATKPQKKTEVAPRPQQKEKA